MYQVLYRKWRPQAFADVYGQNHITAALKNELQTGRLAHAYLFTGSRGTGKTTCAKIMAKAVNCLHPVDGDPCNECDICKGIDSGAIMDVVEIDAASNNGVDNIRDLREEVNFTPAVAKYRVYIIDEVHMLSTGAFNALLKTLEEPPPHVVFILATTEVHKLPATILSRCQRFDFHRIQPADIAARIQYVAGQEQFTVTDEAATLLARLADGALRDALSLLDQCVSRSREITADVVAETTGLAGRQYLFELSAAVRAGDSGAALALIDRLYNASKDMERLCAEWTEYFRNLMILKSVKDAADLIVAPPAELHRMAAEGGEPEAPPLPSNEGPAAGDSLGTDQEVPFERWNDVLDTLSGTCPPLYGVLVDSTALLRGDYVLICTDNDMFKALVTRDGNKNVLLGAIRSVTGRNHRIGVKRSSGAPAAGSSAGQAPPPEDPLAAFLQNSRAQGLDVEFKD